jgi:putative nucleotidyltransferase with HDIG domain
MSGTLLFVDDEQGVLNSLNRLFIDSGIEIFTAQSGVDGIEILKNNQISVIISDNRMPVMTGIEFLQKAKNISPDSVRVLLTAYADLNAAIDAINKGEVYKFVTKPWDDGELKDIVLNAIKRHEVITSLRRADEPALLALAQTIELKDYYTRGHCDRVANYAISIAERFGLDGEMQKHILHGGWLHDAGKIGVPETVLNFQGKLSAEQFEIIKNHPAWGAEVAKTAHLPMPVVNIILYHHERYDGKGYPFGLKAEEIPLEARIVSVADTYDALTSDRPYRGRMPYEKAQVVLIESKGLHFDPNIVDIFLDIVGKPTDDR